ncbi:MAG: hypothetical protein OHK0047_37100 [Leptolyngbyaceae cyanobacterium]
MAATEETLRQLQPGDLIYYHGVQWRVKDVSHYRDPDGYETEEWLLKSPLSKEYYLLREVDPENPTAEVNWYIAEQLRNPAIYEPGSSRDLLTSLAYEMRSGREPYPQLQTLNRIYIFESKTEGTYESEDGSEYRITWDYWDAAHLWNLALEAWSDSSLSVYSTRKVRPADFSQPQSPYRTGANSTHQAWAGYADANRRMAGFRPTASGSYLFGLYIPREQQFVLACVLLFLGLVLMLSGI